MMMGSVATNALTSWSHLLETSFCKFMACICYSD